MIALDTDILAIHHLFTWDPRRSINEQLYERVKGNASTTIHNLLELLGLFSLSGLSSRVEHVMERYLKSKEIFVIFPSYHEDWGKYVSNTSSYIKRGLSYGDALIAEAIEESDVEAFITWNKKHFEGKLKVKVFTPKEY